jgi:peptidyl-Lys metalloendopeptidase
VAPLVFNTILTKFSVSEAYNFTSSGEGRYSIEPGTLFHYITKEKTIVPIYATLDSALATSLTGTLAVDHFVAPSAANKRATFTGCSTASQTTLIAAIKQANTYASSAYSYISGISTGTTRYTTWFGTYSTSRKATVQSHYQKISTSNFDSFTYTCTCTSICFSFYQHSLTRCLLRH